ncbi:MAG: zinc-ribbon domain-containing protein [Nitrososphaeraceae archaeon]
MDRKKSRLFENKNWLKDLLKIILIIVGVFLIVSFVVPFPYSFPIIIGLIVLIAWLIRRRNLKATIRLKCDNCGNSNELGSGFCNNCGSKLD